MTNNKNSVRKNQWVILILISIFVVYNIIVYTYGTSNNTPKMSELAIEGERLYQEHNCTSCHQLFGLGGYLGPDLTNIVSDENKGAAYAKAFLNSGIKVMPKFNFTAQEQNAIVQFLTEVDQCGYYPIAEPILEPSGWVDMSYKNQ